MMAPSISLNELQAYHKIDREVFFELVVTLMRDPAESLIAIALWFWLEENGYPNIIAQMMELSDWLINGIADEAAFCVSFLQSGSDEKLSSLPAGGMPLTASVMERGISIGLFHRNRFTAIAGIRSFLNSVCARIFTDILQYVSDSKKPVLAVPGFPHPLFGNVVLVPVPMNYDISVGGLWGWSSRSDVAADDRTMFLTFSRGFPVTKSEVREVFTRLFGNCVENVEMQGSQESGSQPLFARMVVRSISIVDKILVGKTIAKFWVNGKHIWARKYERRD